MRRQKNAGSQEICSPEELHQFGALYRYYKNPSEMPERKSYDESYCDTVLIQAYREFWPVVERIACDLNIRMGYTWKHIAYDIRYGRRLAGQVYERHLDLLMVILCKHLGLERTDVTYKSLNELRRSMRRAEEGGGRDLGGRLSWNGDQPLCDGKDCSHLAAKPKNFLAVLCRSYSQFVPFSQLDSNARGKATDGLRKCKCEIARFLEDTCFEIRTSRGYGYGLFPRYE
jgi:hypothetical protein